MNKGRWDGTVIRWQHLETEFNIGGEVGGKRIETNDPANVEQFNIQRTRRGRFTSRRVRIVGKSPASVRSTDLALLPPAPFFRHPFHPARFVNSTRNEIEMFTVAGIASFPRLSLHCLHEARGYLDLLPPYLENSKFPSQGCTEGGRRKRKKKVVETFPLFESRT